MAMVCGFGVLYSKGIIDLSSIIHLLLLITRDSILYSRRPKGRLSVNQKKIGMIDKKILPYSWAVKGKIAYGNSPRFSRPD